jgi:CrcB protein
MWRLLIATGFVGAYTTFSTFEYETERLAQSGAIGWGVLNVVTSVLAGFFAVRLGVILARR